jgi:hypothetical protein
MSVLKVDRALSLRQTDVPCDFAASRIRPPMQGDRLQMSDPDARPLGPKISFIRYRRRPAYIHAPKLKADSTDRLPVSQIRPANRLMKSRVMKKGLSIARYGVRYAAIEGAAYSGAAAAFGGFVLYEGAANSACQRLASSQGHTTGTLAFAGATVGGVAVLGKILRTLNRRAEKRLAVLNSQG